MIHHLCDIIDRLKEDVIILTFDCQRCDKTLCFKCLPGYGITVLEPFDIMYMGWDKSFSSIQTFYSDISFLLSKGISAECHRSILKFQLFAFISWISFLIDGWYLSLYCYLVIFYCPLTGFYRSSPDENDEPDDRINVDELDNQFDTMLGCMQWEYHLSRANTSQMIHDQLLTIHYIYAIKEYDFWNKTPSLERLPTPLLRGGLAWLRVSYYELPVHQSHELIVGTL